MIQIVIAISILSLIGVAEVVFLGFIFIRVKKTEDNQNKIFELIETVTELQEKMKIVQSEIVVQIDPALRATVKNREDITLLASKFEDFTPQKVYELVTKRIDYHGTRIEKTIRNGVYVRFDERRDKRI